MKHLIKKTCLYACVALLIGSTATIAQNGRRNERWRDTPNRFWAQLQDGNIIIGRDLRDWNHEKGNAHIDGKRLFDANNPLRLLRDTTVQPQRYGAFVQFHNGDVLPGKVIAARGSDAANGLPQHLVVMLHEPLLSFNRSAEVAIRPSAVARIVVQGPGKGPFEPGTIFFEDGRRVRIKAVRWSGDGLRALTEEGFVSASWLEIAEVHLPQDAETVIEALAEDLTTPSPEADSRIGRVVTESAGVFTYRRAMVKIDNERDKHFGQYHAFQPAWSFDTIRVPIDYIVTRSYRNHNEMPLSLLPAKTLSQRSFTGTDWQWRRNRNVRDGELASENMIADLGIGMHSHTEVAFDLPAQAKQFSTWVGIDNAVGGGGCVRCFVYLDKLDSKPVWQSEFLRGGAAPVKVGPIDLKDAKHLILVADYGHDRRPRGADPLDIRDEVSWLFPTVTVDVDAFPVSHRMKELAQAVPQLSGWTLGDTYKDKVEYRTFFAKDTGRWGMTMYRDGNVEHKAEDILFELERTVKVNEANAMLVVQAGRGESELEGHVVSVTVNGEQHNSYLNGDVRTNRSPGSFDEKVYPLGMFVGQEIKLTLQVHPLRNGKYQTASLLWGAADLIPIVEALPESGKFLKPDIAITSLKPTNIHIKPSDKKDGKELIANQTTDGKPLHIRHFPIAEGFGMPPGESKITYTLDPSWKQFVAVVGMGDGTYGAGPYEVLLDEAVVWTTIEPGKRSDSSGQFERSSQGKQVVIDIPAGHKTITLKVSRKSRSFAVWGYAGFNKE